MLRYLPFQSFPVVNVVVVVVGGGGGGGGGGDSEREMEKNK